MSTHSKRRLVAAVLSLCMLLSVCSFPAVAVAGWTPVAASVVYVVTDELSGLTDEMLARLDDAVSIFVAEYAATCGRTLTVRYGLAADIGATDLVVWLDPASGYANEAYSIMLEEGTVEIHASSTGGILYGLRDALKQMMTNDAVSAVATTTPGVAERSVSLDNGRKYFTVDWIKQLIREMSWNNMNTLVLHFSEEMGLGIESELYPWLNGRDGTLCTQAVVEDDHRQLTQDEVREIIAYAQMYHVDVVPSLDGPGHMNYIVKRFNEHSKSNNAFSFVSEGVTWEVPANTDIGNYFHYNGMISIVQGSGPAGSVARDYSRGIDISNKIAVAFTKSLIEEYATLFAEAGCTKIDIGGDELLGWGTAITSSVNRWKQLDHWAEYAQEQTGNSKAVAYDAFLLYMNDMNDFVRELGYTSVRMWNDNVLRQSDTGWNRVVHLDKNIDVWYWSTGTAPVADYVNSGYEIYNIQSEYTYYVLTTGYLSNSPEKQAEKVYKNWTPYMGIDTGNIDMTAGVLGGALGIWCDNPTLLTEEEMMEGMLPLLRAIAVKCWDADISDSYATWCAKMQAIGDAPAVTVVSTKPTQPSETEPETEVPTDPETEAPTEPETEAPTEPETEAPTEPETEAPTEPETEVPTEPETEAPAEPNPNLPDNSEILTLLEEAEVIRAEQEAAIATTGKPKWTPISYDNYMFVVNEAKTYMTTAESLAQYTQAHVDTMASTIRAARNNLCDDTLSDPLRELIMEYLLVYQPRHEKEPYTTESWMYYVTWIQYGEEVLSSGEYDSMIVNYIVTEIKLARDALIPEAQNTDEHIEGLVSAGFTTTSVRRGRRARMVVHTKRDMNVNITWVSILEPSGVPLMSMSGSITEMPIDPNNPEVRSFYVVFPVDLEKGTHVYRVYGTVDCVDESGTVDDFQFTSDYVDCAITVY